MNYTSRQLHIFWLIFKNQTIGIAELIALLKNNISLSSLNRDLSVLKNDNLLLVKGKGPNTKYTVPLESLLSIDLPTDEYFKTEPDDRIIISKFNFSLFDALSKADLFTNEELVQLNE